MTRRAAIAFAGALVLGAALLVTACLSSAPRAVFVEMPAGTTFTTRRTDTGSFGSGTALVDWRKEDRTFEGRHVAAFVSDDVTFLDDASGGFLAVLGPDGKPVVRFDPVVNLAWPLSVGKAWTSRHTLSVPAQGLTIPLQATWQVESYEDLKTPAGTFKAFKVHYVDDVGNDNLEYVSAELGLNIRREWRRIDSHPLGPGTRLIELVAIAKR